MNDEPSHLDEWQPLHLRYGLIGWQDLIWRDKLPWGARHDTSAPRADMPEHLFCACRTFTGAGCGLRATQEDGLCDECRQWCIAVDSDGYYHQLSSLW